MTAKGSMLTVELPLNPHREQEKKLNLILSACRSTYNDLLETCRDILIENRRMKAEVLEMASWETEGLLLRPDYLPLPSEFDLMAMAGELREVNLWRREAYGTCVREVGHRVSKTVADYFDDIGSGIHRGLPRFKSVDRYDTFAYTASNQYSFDPEWLAGRRGPRIYLGGVGMVHFRNEGAARCLPSKGIMKQAIIKRKRSCNKDFWSIIIYYDTVEPKEYREFNLEGPIKMPVGIDVGARKTAVFSDGTVVANPGTGERNLERKKKLGRRITEAGDDKVERRKWISRLNHLRRYESESGRIVSTKPPEKWCSNMI